MNEEKTQDKPEDFCGHEVGCNDLLAFTVKISINDRNTIIQALNAMEVMYKDSHERRIRCPKSAQSCVDLKNKLLGRRITRDETIQLELI